MPTTKKWAVHYKSRAWGNTNVHVFANTAADAVQHVTENGIGYDNGPVFADKITGVEEVRY